jgi:hypothetical protein
LNAFLSIEIQSGEVFFDTQDRMKADNVAWCVHHTASALAQRGYNKMIMYIDNNPAHKTLMRFFLALLPRLPIDIQIKHLPPYSPKLNIVEYLIHLIRQKNLHHAPHSQDIGTVKQRLSNYLCYKKPFEQEMIYNILDHIDVSVRLHNLTT